MIDKQITLQPVQPTSPHPDPGDMGHKIVLYPTTGGGRDYSTLDEDVSLQPILSSLESFDKQNFEQ